jgi:hypothetical protein
MTRHLLRNRRDRDLAPLQDPALAPLHAALTAEPSAAEVAAQPDALLAFRAVSWGRAAGEAPARRPAWRPAVLSSVFSTVFATKLSAALAAGTVGLSGAAAAAYTGNLPDTLQDVAHDTIQAPAAHPNPKASGTPVGPDATGPAAYGLCQAFDKDKEHGKAKEKSIAFRNLAEAAGGADKVEAYCATVPKPSDSPSAKTTGKPTSTPAHPTGKPTSVPAHPTGKPTAAPTQS